MIQYKMLGVLASLLAAGLASAGSDQRLRDYLALPLEELMQQTVSISTHTEQSLSKAPSVVTVVTEDDIKATGATNLAAILQSVPGIYVRRQQFAFRPLISFRGTNDKQTLIMVDGAPVSDLMWRAGIFWKGLPATIIDRVEIIRGPGSALFGSDASAGVINVITKTSGKIENSELGVRAGSFDTRSAWAQYGGEWNGFDVAMTADLYRTDGHDPFIASDAQSHNDRVTGSSASLAPGNAEFGWKNADLRLSIAKDVWRLQMAYTEQADLESGMTGAGAIDPITEGDATRFDVAFLFDDQQFDDDWGVRGELRYRNIDYSSGDGFQEWPPGFENPDDNPPRVPYPDGVTNHMDSAENGFSGELSGLYRGAKDHAITLGAGFRWQDIYRVEQQTNFGVDGNGNALPPGGPLVDLSNTPYAFAPEESRTIGYLYLQDAWTITDDLELTAGARFDHYSDFGGTTNPRIALVWDASDSTTIKLLYGQAFRAPYFQELYSETSFSLPNSGLDPERSETWEFAVSYMASDRLRLGANLYRYEQRDSISLEPVAGLSKRQYQNSGDYNVNGMELEAWWQPLEELSLSANYTYNDPDDSPFRTSGVPQRQAYLRLDWRFMPDWNWNIQGNWIGEIERNTEDVRSDLDDYLVADATVRYAGIRNWELAASVRNIFDEGARAATSWRMSGDLPLPERSIYIEARYDLDRLVR